jgi:hypothetical protein
MLLSAEAVSKLGFWGLNKLRIDLPLGKE